MQIKKHVNKTKIQRIASYFDDDKAGEDAAPARAKKSSAFRCSANEGRESGQLIESTPSQPMRDQSGSNYGRGFGSVVPTKHPFKDGRNSPETQ
jgi:hypothetical protein